MYLLDTHTLLWALFKEDFLSMNAKKVILDDNDIALTDMLRTAKTFLCSVTALMILLCRCGERLFIFSITILF